MIKIYPEIILQAKHQKLPPRGVCVWFLAKGFDMGNGHIPVDSFHDHLRNLRIPESTTRRWLILANNLNLVENLGQVYRLASWQKGAMLVGLERLSRPVFVPIEHFVGHGWLAWVWAGFLKSFEKNPISRATLEKLSGVPVRTQFDYERKAGVEKIDNYAYVCDPVTSPDVAMAVYDRPGYYPKDGKIMRRLPNTYRTQGVIQANKGRTRQVNRALRHEVSSPRTFHAVYYQSDRERERVDRLNRRYGDAMNKPKFLYERFTDPNGGVSWRAVEEPR